jgi:guanylate cyclase
MGLRESRRTAGNLPALVDWLLSFGQNPSDPEDLRRLKRVLAGALWISLAPNTVFMTITFTSGHTLAGLVLLALEIELVGTLVVWKLRPRTYPGIFHFLVAGNYVVLVAMTIVFGGLVESGANFVWGFAAVLAAVTVFRDGRALVWLAVYVILLVGTEIAMADRTGRYELPDPGIQGVATISVVAVFVFLVLLYFIRQRDALAEEAESLLRNVLPDEIAVRLRRSGDMIADHFADASILFADVVGFTPMSAAMTPAQTVQLLNEVFSVFDDMVDDRGLEKIKTVGDEYMVAAGVPHQRGDHAHALADLALAMRGYVEAHEVAGRKLTFRMGINSGPVVAGIIGRKKFAYDLWGDAVNTASRMESHGDAGRIQISESTYRLIHDDFECTPRGEIELKGKGRVPTWYLEGRRESSGSAR